MNDRETFEFVKAHLLKQNAKALGDIGCAYKSPGGLKCAVGCLIKDEYYSAELEGLGLCEQEEFSFEPKHYAEIVKAVRDSGCNASLSLLHRLQVIHDSYDPSQWAEKLESLHASL